MSIINDPQPIADFTQSKPTYTLSSDFVWRDSVRQESYIVRKDYTYDGASIPRILFWWNWGVWHYAAILHDYAYDFGFIGLVGYPDTKHLSKSEADELFYRCLLDLGTNKVTAWLMYLAVSLFGKYKFTDLEI